jgi:hypothetical protein
MGKSSRGPIDGKSYISTPGPKGYNNVAGINKSPIFLSRRGPMGLKSKMGEGYTSHITKISAYKADDEDRNPANLVLGDYETTSRYVRKIKSAFGKWGAMTVNERGTFLVNAAMEELMRLKIPPPKIGPTRLANIDGVFIPSKWAIGIKKETLTGYARNDIANAAATVIHEFEHLAEAYVSAQYLATQNLSSNEISRKLNVPDRIAKHAIAHPLDPNNRKRMTLGKECFWRITADSKRNKNQKPRPGSPFGRSSYEVTKMRLDAAEAKLERLEKSPHIEKKEYYQALDEVKALRKEYSLTNVELGSSLIGNIVKSLLLR